jgi:hypothetical protein
VVWGVSAAVYAALVSARPAEVGAFPGPEPTVGSGTADVGPPARRTPLVAVPDDPGTGTGLTAPPAGRGRRSDARAPGRSGGNPAPAPDQALLAQVLRGFRQLD